MSRPSGEVIADAWETFERLTVPPMAGAQQRADLRAAFYCGAYSVWAAVYEIGRADCDESRGFAVLDGIGRECRAFQLHPHFHE